MLMNSTDNCLTPEPLCDALSYQSLPVDLRQAGDDGFRLVNLTEAPQQRGFDDCVRLLQFVLALHLRQLHCARLWSAGVCINAEAGVSLALPDNRAL